MQEIIIDHFAENAIRAAAKERTHAKENEAGSGAVRSWPDDDAGAVCVCGGHHHHRDHDGRDPLGPRRSGGGHLDQLQVPGHQAPADLLLQQTDAGRVCGQRERRSQRGGPEPRGGKLRSGPSGHLQALFGRGDRCRPHQGGRRAELFPRQDPQCQVCAGALRQHQHPHRRAEGVHLHGL